MYCDFLGGITVAVLEHIAKRCAQKQRVSPKLHLSHKTRAVCTAPVKLNGVDLVFGISVICVNSVLLILSPLKELGCNLLEERV